MKIEFGCGETPTRKDFKTCDVRNLKGVDFVCNAWDIGHHVPVNSVDEIFSRHFFEHLTFRQGERTLKSWHNILKSGGVCEMILPNMSFHILQWITRSDMSHAIAGFWGFQRGEFDDIWDIHKSGYDFPLLKDVVSRCGFIDVKDLTTGNGQHLHIKFYKR